jgi:hypothetical protein
LQKHNLEAKLALLTLRAPFSVPSDHVLLLEEVILPGQILGEVVHPIPQASYSREKMHPIAFYFDGDTLQPFKYSLGSAADHGITMFSAFIAEYYVALAW